MDYTAIGARVKYMREAKRLTQAVLSERANVSQSFLGHIERGTRVMSIETLARLAQALDCSTDYLLGIASVPGSAYAQALEHIRSWIEGEISFMEENMEGE